MARAELDDVDLHPALVFMENRSTTHAPVIADLDAAIVPAGDGKTSFVAAADVAAVTTQPPRS